MRVRCKWITAAGTGELILKEEDKESKPALKPAPLPTPQKADQETHEASYFQPDKDLKTHQGECVKPYNEVKMYEEAWDACKRR